MAKEHVEKESKFCGVATVPAGLDDKQMQSIIDIAGK